MTLGCAVKHGQGSFLFAFGEKAVPVCIQPCHSIPIAVIESGMILMMLLKSAIQAFKPITFLVEVTRFRRTLARPSIQALVLSCQAKQKGRHDDTFLKNCIKFFKVLPEFVTHL